MIFISMKNARALARLVRITCRLLIIAEMAILSLSVCALSEKGIRRRSVSPFLSCRDDFQSGLLTCCYLCYKADVEYRATYLRITGAQTRRVREKQDKNGLTVDASLRTVGGKAGLEKSNTKNDNNISKDGVPKSLEKAFSSATEIHTNGRGTIQTTTADVTSFAADSDPNGSGRTTVIISPDPRSTKRSDRSASEGSGSKSKVKAAGSKDAKLKSAEGSKQRESTPSPMSALSKKGNKIDKKVGVVVRGMKRIKREKGTATNITPALTSKQSDVNTPSAPANTLGEAPYVAPIQNIPNRPHLSAGTTFLATTTQSPTAMPPVPQASAPGSPAPTTVKESGIPKISFLFGDSPATIQQEVIEGDSEPSYSITESGCSPFQSLIGTGIYLAMDYDGTLRKVGYPPGFLFKGNDRLYSFVISRDGSINLRGDPNISQSVTPISDDYLDSSNSYESVSRISVLQSALDPTYQGGIYVLRNATHFIVSWEDVAMLDDPSMTVSAQIVLFQTGAIELRWGDGNLNGMDGSKAQISAGVKDGSLAIPAIGQAFQSLGVTHPGYFPSNSCNRLDPISANTNDPPPTSTANPSRSLTNSPTGTMLSSGTSVPSPSPTIPAFSADAPTVAPSTQTNVPLSVTQAPSPRPVLNLIPRLPISVPLLLPNIFSRPNFQTTPATSAPTEETVSESSPTFTATSHSSTEIPSAAPTESVSTSDSAATLVTTVFVSATNNPSSAPTDHSSAATVSVTAQTSVTDAPSTAPTKRPSRGHGTVTIVKVPSVSETGSPTTAPSDNTATLVTTVFVSATDNPTVAPSDHSRPTIAPTSHASASEGPTSAPTEVVTTKHNVATVAATAQVSGTENPSIAPTLGMPTSYTTATLVTTVYVSATDMPSATPSTIAAPTHVPTIDSPTTPSRGVSRGHGAVTIVKVPSVSETDPPTATPSDNTATFVTTVYVSATEHPSAAPTNYASAATDVTTVLASDTDSPTVAPTKETSTSYSTATIVTTVYESATETPSATPTVVSTTAIPRVRVPNTAGPSVAPSTTVVTAAIVAQEPTALVVVPSGVGTRPGSQALTQDTSLVSSSTDESATSQLTASVPDATSSLLSTFFNSTSNVDPNGLETEDTTLDGIPTMSSSDESQSTSNGESINTSNTSSNSGTDLLMGGFGSNFGFPGFAFAPMP
jgi:hypothetical protein